VGLERRVHLGDARVELGKCGELEVF
jgi:hypothetical protein